MSFLPLQYSASFGLALSRTPNMAGFIISDDRGFHLSCMNIKSEDSLEKFRQLYSNKRLTLGPVFPHGGEIVVMASSGKSGKPQYSVLA
jgi:hypothetical protein